MSVIKLTNTLTVDAFTCPETDMSPRYDNWPMVQQHHILRYN